MPDMRRAFLYCLKLEDRTVPATTITVDATADLHAIDPRIYGTAFGSAAQVNDINAPTNRWGGNTTSRYNYLQNAANHANDYYFESLLQSGGATVGGSINQFVQDSINGQSAAMVTIPAVGWVAKVQANGDRLVSYSIAKYGAQTGNDAQWYPDAGNGIRASDGVKITWNDKNDANIPADQTFQKGFVQHLQGKFGTAAQGGVRYYAIDNEPSIWHETHRDIHPDGAPMQEVADKLIAYSAAIKSQDSGGYVMGPEEFGWSGYFLSGKDLKYGGETNDWGNLPDKKAHGNADSVPWILSQLKAYDAANGTRTLDAFTLHIYPQGGEFGDDVTQAMQLKRNRSTRSLWDPTYVDESWIGNSGQPDGGRVKLIPRMRAWADAYRPGMDIGITEYNWGAEGHTNGATAQADIFGILGKYDVDMASRWTTPATGSPAYLAMKLWRNYDGLDRGFGDVGARATVPNPDLVSAYVSRRSSDGALIVAVINKNLYNSTTPTATEAVTVNLSHFAAGGPIQQWRLAATNPSIQTAASITQQANVTLTGSSFTYNAAMQSVTLFVIPPAVQPAPTVTPVIGDGTTQRSRFNTVTLNFSELVTLGTGAIEVQRTGPGGTIGNVPFTIDTSASTGTQTIAKLTFGTPFLQGGSLVDGNYFVKITGNLVLDTQGRSMAADQTVNFHRLFGDADGDRDVDNADFSAFRLVFGNGPSIFDADGDGDTDNADFTTFRTSFGTTLP